MSPQQCLKNGLLKNVSLMSPTLSEEPWVTTYDTDGQIGQVIIRYKHMTPHSSLRSHTLLKREESDGF